MHTPPEPADYHHASCLCLDSCWFRQATPEHDCRVGRGAGTSIFRSELMHMKSQIIVLHALALLCLAPLAALGQPAVSPVAMAPPSAVAIGQSITMTVSASGSSLAFQWKLDGANIPGATGASYGLPMVGAADRGSYQVVVTGAGGTATLEMGTLSVMSGDARLMNLSGRAMIGTGSDVMIAGFVSRGDASSTNKNILFRGMGPALTGMGGMSSGVLSNPVLMIYDGQSSPMGSNMGWTNAPTRMAGGAASRVQTTMQSVPQAMMTALGAFTTGMSSADSALMMNGPHGAYTAMMSGAGNSNGIGLVECYDADAALGNGANTARLVNMSVRANVGPGTNGLIAGFVMVGGSSGSPGTVLLRAMGPVLAAMGVSGAMPGPTMMLYDGNSRPIASNSGWSNGPMMATGVGASTTRAGVVPASMGMMASLGAFPPTPGSADCAMVATLPAGAYTVVVSGLPDSSGRAMTGVVLCEVYEVR